MAAAFFARENGIKAEEWIPFRVDQSKQIEVNVTVNGQTARAVLDTGATRSALDRSFAQKIGLETRGAFQGYGLTAPLHGGLAPKVAIAVGRHRICGLEMAVLDFSAMSAALGLPVDLILGREFFESNLVEIDFPRGRLRLHPPGMKPSVGAVQDFPETPDRLRALPIELGNGIRIEAAVDLGSNVALYVHPALAERSRLLEGLKTSTAASAGAEGIEISTVASLATISFSGVQFKAVPVHIPRIWHFASEVLVGLPILSRFRLALDFSFSRAWIKPDASLVNTQFAKDRSGLGAVPGQRSLHVIHVARGSPAQRSGIFAGDEIITVNGRGVDEAYLLERPRIGQGAPGSEIVLELSNHEFRHFVLEDYF